MASPAMRDLFLRLAYRWWLSMMAVLGVGIGLQLSEWLRALQHYGVL